MDLPGRGARWKKEGRRRAATMVMVMVVVVCAATATVFRLGSSSRALAIM